MRKLTLKQHHTLRSLKAFSLVELLVVISILVIILAVSLPAFTKSSPRRAAIIELRSVLEYARAFALKERTEVFVAFTDHLPGATFADADGYRFTYYSIYARDKTNWDPSNRYFNDQLTLPVSELIPVRAWTKLSKGMMLALGQDLETLPGEPILTISDVTDPLGTGTVSTAQRLFPFPIEGPASTRTLPFFLFNEEGRIRYPTFDESHYHYIGLVEGSFAAGSREISNYMPRSDGTGDKPTSEVLALSLYSGRIRLVSRN